MIPDSPDLESICCVQTSDRRLSVLHTFYMQMSKHYKKYVLQMLMPQSKGDRAFTAVAPKLWQQSCVKMCYKNKQRLK